MPSLRPHRRLWLLVAALLIIAGIGIAVRADRDPPAEIIPYDPLPRW
jgi:hypothetical protein